MVEFEEFIETMPFEEMNLEKIMSYLEKEYPTLSKTFETASINTKEIISKFVYHEKYEKLKEHIEEHELEEVANIYWDWEEMDWNIES